MTRWRSSVAAVLVWGIRGYQLFISPALPRSCKYYPSCSQYAIDAFKQYGLVRGFVLAAWRLLRCNPLSYGGYDPVEHQTLFAHRDSQVGGHATDEDEGCVDEERALAVIGGSGRVLSRGSRPRSDGTAGRPATAFCVPGKSRG